MLSVEKLFDNINVGIFIIDAQLEIRFWNYWLEIYSGISKNDAQGVRLDTLFSFDDEALSAIKRRIKAALLLKSPSFFSSDLNEYLLPILNRRFTQTPFKYMQQDVTVMPFDVLKGQTAIILYDQTAIKETNLLLEAAVEKNREYFNLVDQNVITSSTDLEGKICEVSAAFCKITGYTRQELIGQPHNFIRHPNTKPALFNEVWKQLKEGKEWSGEIQNCRKDGASIWFYTRIKPLYEHEVIKGYMSVHHDITDKKTIESMLVTDQLTGLYNRYYFNECFPRLLKKALSHQKTLSLALLDIDDLKRYNDTYGNHQGDHALLEVSRMIALHLRHEAVYGFRMGGDEFAFLVLGALAEEAEAMVIQILKAVEDLKMENPQGTHPYITLSAGFVSLEVTRDVDTYRLYALADEALRCAKKEGRNGLYKNRTHLEA